MNDSVLCYVNGSWAWFTTCAVGEQKGDDWDDAPYESNAGDPYKWSEKLGVTLYTLTKVAWEGPFYTPTYLNTRRDYSVDQVNRRFVPWLTPYDIEHEPVFAGDTLAEFTRKVSEAGGVIYFQSNG